MFSQPQRTIDDILSKQDYSAFTAQQRELLLRFFTTSAFISSKQHDIDNLLPSNSTEGPTTSAAPYEETSRPLHVDYVSHDREELLATPVVTNAPVARKYGVRNTL